MKQRKNTILTYPIILEVLVWILYVLMYKYSYHLEHDYFPPQMGQNFPYPILCLYACCSSLYLIFYYRYLVPKLLSKKRYTWLLGLSFVYIVILGTWNNRLTAYFFSLVSSMPEKAYFHALQQGYLDWNLITTDTIAFLAVGISIFSYRNEISRRKMETEHLKLQMQVLKAQLQPHFLFNALNGIYALSLNHPKDTSSSILLLSQLMHYILHDAAREEVPLKEELHFMNSYFAFERLRFPQATIHLQINDVDDTLTIPPLLFLPLIENSFKHGKQTAIDQAEIKANVALNEEGWLTFRIANERLPLSKLSTTKKSGIGLSNLRKRLERYYPDQHHLQVDQTENHYIAEFKIKIR
ncbi:hypothetical protein GCM10023231_16870 [Olivibacter ginsenosidimutans]|uniref:Signal transduction histidine kinase internal region domain-containing protein n=1 Tax=Olivibacter ginsenosidimutans TaxID=1176537 RepID=A0ABP9B1A5_9SPHI